MMIVAVHPTGSSTKRIGAAVCRVPQVVVIDHAKQFGLLQPLHRLAAMIVIDQDHPLAPPAQQIAARNNPQHHPFIVHHRQNRCPRPH
ncbi:MAG: hypothetical protein U0841_12920 [Chloroflexia bacterium]